MSSQKKANIPPDLHRPDAAHSADVPLPPLMTAPELVEYLRLPTLAALYTLRHRGGGPPAIRIQRQLLFRHSDVEHWLTSQMET